MSRLRGWDVVSYEDIHDIYQKRILELEAERDRLDGLYEAQAKVSAELTAEAVRLADALRDVQKRIPVWGQGMTDTDWRDAHRVLRVVRAALAGTEQP